MSCRFKCIAFIFAAIMVIFSSCGAEKEPYMNSAGVDTKNTVTVNGEKADGSKKGSAYADDVSTRKGKTLIAYFSCTGTTQNVAKFIESFTDGVLFEIVPTEKYSKKDLEYTNSTSRTSIEDKNESSRPAILNSCDDFDEYDTIFIGYPIWHGKAPKIIYTFIENYDFCGKTVIPFCTSHSSDIGKSDEYLHELCSEGVNWLNGKRFSKDADDEEINEWINSLGIYKNEAGIFDFENKRVLLNSGYYMPIVGLGTYALDYEECVNSVNALLENGGRLIDTASVYRTEESVGDAIRSSGIPREEIFVTTKLYPNQFSDPVKAIDESLKALDIEYIDLLMLHHPGTNDVDAYKAIEQAVRNGKVRSIGLSNWYIQELDEFLPQVEIMPSVVQNEIHPYYQENDVIPYIQSFGIVVEGWYPFGGRGHTKELLSDSVISSIAEEHNVTSAQVILRWNLQRGVVVIPGSSNPEHIKENLDVFGFELTDNEMKSIELLDRNEKHDWY